MKRLPYYISVKRGHLFAKEVLNKLFAGRISCYHANKLLGRGSYECRIMVADVVVGSGFDRRKRTSQKKLTIITVKMPKQLVELLEDIARRAGMSRSDVIRAAVCKFLREIRDGKVS